MEGYFEKKKCDLMKNVVWLCHVISFKYIYMSRHQVLLLILRLSDIPDNVSETYFIPQQKCIAMLISKVLCPYCGISGVSFQLVPDSTIQCLLSTWSPAR